MRRLLSLAFTLIVGILVYNYFFGTDEEKQQSQRVFKKTTAFGKELGGEIKNLIKNERERYDEGKYDKVIDKVKTAINGDETLSEQHRDQLVEIETLQQELEKEQRRKLRDSSLYDEQHEQELKRELDLLLDELSNQLSE